MINLYGVTHYASKLFLWLLHTSYSDSVVDTETHFCRALPQATGPPLINRMYPVVDLRVSKSPA